MRLTLGKNKSAFEEQLYTIQIIISKRRSISFSINKPISFNEFMKTMKTKNDNKINWTKE